MIFLLSSHAVFALLGAVLLHFTVGDLAMLSFLAGAGVAFANLAALCIAWPLILAKKLVALSIGVIVFKFAILGWIINIVVTGKYLSVGWFAVGLGLVIASVLATSVKVSRTQNAEEPLPIEESRD